MGQPLFIESLTIHTQNDSVTYEFAEGVTAVTGNIGTGKSSMLETIKYGLGGSARVMPAVRDNVKQVILRVRAGSSYLELRRGLGERTIEVFDGYSDEFLTHWATRPRRNVRQASQELLTLVGLPSNMRTPKRRSRPGAETVAISFFDIYRYLYLSQDGIDRSIVGHDDQNLNVKRIAVFELMYGLSSQEVMELAAERGRYSDEANRLRAAAKSVSEFLATNSELDPEALSRERTRAEEASRLAEQRLADIRERTAEINALGARASMIAGLRAQLVELEAERQALQRDVEKDRSVLAQLELDEHAVHREEVASHSLSGLEFTRCPRCMQSIREKDEPAGHCILCGLPDPAMATSSSSELIRIRDQRKETQELLTEDRANLDRVSVEADRVRDNLSREIEISARRTYDLADPLLDEVAEAARAAAAANAGLESIVAAQARWAVHGGLIQQADEAESTSRRLAREEARLRMDLAEGTTRIDDLSELFNEILAGLRDPWYHEAHIDPSNYMPIVDGEEFDMLSIAGARKTLVNLAYHLANLGMSLSHSQDVKFPPLLIIDSPRKNVGAGGWDRSVAEAVYQRLETLNAARRETSAGKFQIIIADNELPSSAKNWMAREIPLDYNHPFVPGVGHQGKSVETLGGASTVELA